MTSASQPTSVYVGDLPMEFNKRETIITEDFLRNLFNELGNIVVNEIAIKNREGRNGIPYAYAFVKFQTREMAERVINELNYTKLENVPIRLCLADAETNKIRKSNTGNLFIKNLDPEIEVSQLHDAFANFGEIISCKIPTDYISQTQTYKSRGYGYVQFRNPKDAEQACIDLKDAAINGRQVTIEPFCRRPKLNPEETFTNLYLKELPESIKTTEDLKGLVEPYGKIQSPFLPLDEEKKPKGFGFCNMETHEDALAATEGLNGKEIDGKKLVCVRHQTRQEHLQKLREISAKWRKSNYEKYKGRNLYIRGFNKDTTEDQLEEKFKQYGDIESLKIMRDENDNSKEFGFVCFKNKDDAKKCIEGSVALMVVNDKQVYTAMAMTKDERLRMTTTIQQKKNNIVSKSQYQTPGMPVQVPIMSYPLNPVTIVDNMNANKNKRDLLRQEIMEKFGNQDAQPYLQRLKDLSDDQVEALSADHDLLEKFYNAK